MNNSDKQIVLSIIDSWIGKHLSVSDESDSLSHQVSTLGLGLQVKLADQLRKEVSSDFQAETDLEAMSESGELSSMIDRLFQGDEIFFASECTKEVSMYWVSSILGWCGDDIDSLKVDYNSQSNRAACEADHKYTAMREGAA